jgi:ParB family chromosome partitioning protein
LARLLHLSVSRSKHWFWTPKILVGEFPQTPPFLTNEKGILKMKNQQTILTKENLTERSFSSVISLPIEKLKPFANHPYKVIDNEDMQSLVESIKSQGVLNPITVRPIDNGEYEIISGHRRVFACKKLGLEFVPAFVKEMTREEAIIVMTDSNLHRDRLLPSEKAFAYKMKLDAIKRQGERTDLTSAQVGHKSLTSVERIAIENDESKTQVQRYISLTKLIPELLQMVDDGKIALSPAVEISKLRRESQELLYKACTFYDCTPSYAQTVRLRKLADRGELSENAIYEIMGEEKANQREKIVIYMDDIKQYYPRNTLPNQIVSDILEMLKKRQKLKTRRGDDRDER